MRKIKGIGFMALLISVIVFAGAQPALGAQKTPLISVNGVPMKTLNPLIYDGDTILISLEDLSTILSANFQWNEAQKSVWIQKNGRTVLFKVSEEQVLKNAGPITLSVSPRFIEEIFYVPLRTITENLGMHVRWEQETFKIKIITGDRLRPSEMVSSKEFNAIIAYTDNGNLWLLDGRKQGGPRQITDTGFTEIIGWSYDGEWFLYKYSQNNQNEGEFLWVLSADGTQNRPVDFAPVYDNYVWSPKENKIIYTVYESVDSGYNISGVIKCADVSKDEIIVSTLMDGDLFMVPSITWTPDGRSITVSMPRTKDYPPTILQLDLNGAHRVLYRLQDAGPIDLDNIYPWAFISLKWSDNGRYLFYHTRMNSGSLTADAVETAVLDTKTMNVKALNQGLKYSEWVAFSPDSERLAYIKGVGRDAQNNKQLELVELLPREIKDLKMEGFVDSAPGWSLDGSDALIFCRGIENDGTIGTGILPNLLVPDQRIYTLDKEGIRTLTKDIGNSADYYPSLSPEGKELIFLRLNRYDQGSIYIQPTDNAENATEILRGVRGPMGYYGNYYPEWMKVYWFK